MGRRGQTGLATVLLTALLLDLLNVTVQQALPLASQTVCVGDWRIGMTSALLLPAVALYLLLLRRVPDGVEGA